MRLVHLPDLKGEGNAIDADELSRIYVDGNSVHYRLKGVSGDAKSFTCANATEANEVFINLTTRKSNMFKNILNDVRQFIEQHRSVIYWLALAFLVDHFFLNGKFREKLHGLVDKLLNKIEKQVDTTTVA